MFTKPMFHIFVRYYNMHFVLNKFLQMNKTWGSQFEFSKFETIKLDIPTPLPPALFHKGALA